MVYFRIIFLFWHDSWLNNYKSIKMQKTSFFIATIIIALFSHAQEKTVLEKILGEKTLPSITLLDMNGKKVNVADYGKSGKITILSFWATWCIPCKKELANMAELQEDWAKKYNTQIVAVSIDDSRNTTKVKPYVDGQRWEYEVLLDVNQDLKRNLNIPSVPFTILVDSEGKIVYTHSGYTEGDEYVLEEQIQKIKK
jgi:cytochrome c biogenesis protein CcmG/thiol:disulfide interchange protein DsbE